LIVPGFPGVGENTEYLILSVFVAVAVKILFIEFWQISSSEPAEKTGYPTVGVVVTTLVVSVLSLQPPTATTFIIVVPKYPFSQCITPDIESITPANWFEDFQNKLVLFVAVEK